VFLILLLLWSLRCIVFCNIPRKNVLVLYMYVVILQCNWFVYLSVWDDHSTPPVVLLYVVWVCLFLCVYGESWVSASIWCLFPVIFQISGCVSRCVYHSYVICVY
jgi:hypothetical protein